MSIIENILWTFIAIPMLFFVSLYFTFIAKFPQFKFKKMINSLHQDNKNENISPISSLLIALSARVGVGTLAGTGLAISIGGAGAIFWMWVSAIITSAATFAENTLAQRFKQIEDKTSFGGPAFYIKEGLGNKKLAALYALILIITYTLGFVAIQMNTLTTVFTENTQATSMIVAVILVLLTGLTITGSIHNVSKFIAKIVPIIAIFFFGIALVFLFINITYIPYFFREILESAFGINSVIGGGVGVAITTGTRRGIFSNEAGLGTGAHAAALTEHKDPREQGYIGIIGIYLTTIVSITLVAFMIMSTSAHLLVMPTGNGIEFLHFALYQLFGITTSFILPVIIFFFGFSTVITAYLYGVMNVKFLTSKKGAILLLRIALLITVFVASVGDPSAIWSIVDTGVAITAVINLIALFLLRKYLK